MWRGVVACVVAVGCRYNFDPISGATGDDGGGSGSGSGSNQGHPDAAVACSAQNMASCMAAGGTCDHDICTIVPDPGQPISCPANMACHVLCGDDTCSETSVTCPAGATCDLFCTGLGSCESALVQCSGATCDLHCDHDMTCEMLNIQCSNGSCGLHCCASNNACNTNMCTTGCVNETTCP